MFKFGVDKKAPRLNANATFLISMVALMPRGTYFS